VGLAVEIGAESDSVKAFDGAVHYFDYSFMLCGIVAHCDLLCSASLEGGVILGVILK